MKEEDGNNMVERSNLIIGFTEIGIQIWCRTHDDNVCHIDFESMKHPINTGVAMKPRGS